MGSFPGAFRAPSMTFQQLTCFLAAIEHGPLLRAAENLDVSQSNLSEQIIRLEEPVGAALFVRTPLIGGEVAPPLTFDSTRAATWR